MAEFIHRISPIYEIFPYKRNHNQTHKTNDQMIILFFIFIRFWFSFSASLLRAHFYVSHVLFGWIYIYFSSSSIFLCLTFANILHALAFVCCRIWLWLFSISYAFVCTKTRRAYTMSARLLICFLRKKYQYLWNI